MTTTATLTSTPRALSAPDHSWLVQSRHQTSEGLILYVRCSQCGAHRVDRLAPAGVVPLGISRVVLQAAQSEAPHDVAP